MKLIASMMVGPGESNRYLSTTVSSLLEFCDEICTRTEERNESQLLSQFDGVYQLKAANGGMEIPSMFEHEGHARQQLFDFTLTREPTHILAIDSDEFITNGHLLRESLEMFPEQDAWTMEIEEVWNVSGDGLSIRCDGGWKPHPISCLYRAPDTRSVRLHGWEIMDRALACGREPMAVRRLRTAPLPTEVCLLHWGWVKKSARAGRYQRYVEHDGGNFHARRHLDSIMFSDDRIVLQHRAWPTGLAEIKTRLLEESK